MTPGLYPLRNLYRGDSYAWRVLIWLDAFRQQPFDLTGIDVKAEIRDEAGSDRAVHRLHVETTWPNIIDITLAISQSAILPAVGVWDLQLTDLQNRRATILRGEVTVIHDVTDSKVVPVVTPSRGGVVPLRRGAAR